LLVLTFVIYGVIGSYSSIMCGLGGSTFRMGPNLV